MNKVQFDVTPAFSPARFAPTGNLQTILSYYFFNAKTNSPCKRHQIVLNDGDVLLLRDYNPVNPVGNVVLLHGLSGDADSSYIQRVAAMFLAKNWRVLCVNHRGAGEGRGLAKNLYHSGRSEDVSAISQFVAREFSGESFFAVGFSLSGNMLLKLLGEKKQPIPAQLAGAVSVCAPIDLSTCSQKLRERKNRIYDKRFSRKLMKALRERQTDFPDFPKVNVPRFPRLYDFDEHVVAPLNGFFSAEDYYEKCNARQFWAGIATPTLVLASDDDPFIPGTIYQGLPENPAVKVILTRGGGHLGFLSQNKTPLGNRRWMDYAILEFFELLRARMIETTNIS